MSLIAGLGSTLMGGLSGLFAGKQKGDAAQNMYTPDDPGKVGYSQDSVQSNIGKAMSNAPTYAGATQDVMNNPMLSQMFGQGGLMNQTGQQISDMYKPENQGLTAQDHTAYGQASGNIARQFGQAEHGLSNSLASRGMSNSGAAGAAFSGIQGNKNEQLAGLQTQIADQRMKTNMQRLGQMQNFMSSLGQQAQGAQGQAFGEHLQGNQQQYDMNKGMLDSMQGQANERIQQQNQGSQQSQGGNLMSGLMGGIGTANSLLGKGGMFASGGAFGGGGSVAPAAKPTQAGGSYVDYSNKV